MSIREREAVWARDVVQLEEALVQAHLDLSDIRELLSVALESLHIQAVQLDRLRQHRHTLQSQIQALMGSSHDFNAEAFPGGE